MGIAPSWAPESLFRARSQHDYKTRAKTKSDVIQCVITFFISLIFITIAACSKMVI